MSHALTTLNPIRLLTLQNMLALISEALDTESVCVCNCVLVGGAPAKRVVNTKLEPQNDAFEFLSL